MNYKISITTDTKHRTRTVDVKNVPPSSELNRVLETQYDNVLQGFWVGEVFFPREHVLYATIEEDKE